MNARSVVALTAIAWLMIVVGDISYRLGERRGRLEYALPEGTVVRYGEGVAWCAAPNGWEAVKK